MLVFHDALFRTHDPSPGHPERPARWDAVQRALRDIAGTVRIARPATDDELRLVHPAAHIARVANAAKRQAPLDPDTACNTVSDDVARGAVGALVDATHAVMDSPRGTGGHNRAFCAVRPPGHHALAQQAMGFCLYASVAIAAEAALARDDVTRVAILDFDAHHGNGTQDIFYDRDDVLYASWHQYPFFPGTGAARETGHGAGLGMTINCPLPAGAGNDALLQNFERRVRPALESYGPDLIFLSAGFDADKRDPLAQLACTAAGFAAVTEAIVRCADSLCGGRVVSALEGGYDEVALEEDVRAHVEVLG